MYGTQNRNPNSEKAYQEPQKSQREYSKPLG